MFLVLSVAMKNPIHNFFYLFVLILVLLSQVSATITVDDNAVVIEEISDGWFFSGDVSDDGEGLVASAFSSFADIQYNIAVPVMHRPVFSALSLRPEARAPPKI